VDFVAFGHPLLEAIVTECQKRDEGFGGGASVWRMPEDVEAGDGVLFDFILRYTDASGEILSEDFLPVFVDADGKVKPEIGDALINHPLKTDDAAQVAAPSASQLRAGLRDLHKIASAYARDKSEEHGEQVSEKRKRDVRIQIEDLGRWRSARSQVHEQRLREYRQRLAEGEDMNVAIRGEERHLQDVEQTYEERRKKLESQLTVVSQAPELLNLAVVIGS
jgi:hypothetical protein